VEERDVAPGEKRRSVAAHDDHPHGLVVARLLAHFAQPHDHAGIERVHDLGPVERDGCDAAIDSVK
jgi:hypothetical protein